MRFLPRRPGWLAIAAVGATALAGSLWIIPSASAIPPSTLTVQKQVGGSPTPGTVFTEHVHCESQFDNFAPTDTDLFFDEHGNPTNGTDPSVVVDAGSVCTVTETVTGGAISVFYECDYEGIVDGGAATPAVGVQFGCPESGPSADPLSVFFEGGDAATITVSNGFVNFPPNGGPNGTPNTIPRPEPFPTAGSAPTFPPPGGPHAGAVAAAPLRVSPQFTG